MSASDKKKLRKEQYAATLTEKQLKEQKEAKKLKTYTLTFAVVMLLVVAIVVGVTLRSPVNSIINQKTHAITFGEYKLTTADFSYYYIDTINEYCNEVYTQYSQTLGTYWAMMLGFNTNAPLDEQMYDEEKNITWAQWFVDQAIENAKQTYTIYEQALANNHKLTEDEQKSLDGFENDLSAVAKNYGYSSVKDYLRITYGDGSTVENYKNYNAVNFYASSYMTAYSDSLEYTDEEIREYEKDKFLNYTNFDYCYYLINVKDYLGEGTKDADGNVTYTDKQKEDALAAAKKDADALVAAKVTTASKFDEAVKALEINKDNKNAACVQGKDVFYEDLNYKEIQEWLGDDARKANDFDAVPLINKTGEGEDAKEEIVGYLVILFQERDDCYDKLVSVRHILAAFPYYYDTEGNQHIDDSAKVKTKTKAEGWLKEWKEGKATEESFAELANKNSNDGDGKSGGLYKDVYPGQMVESFNNWCFDKDRKPGDTGIIETEYGYHIMYFVETQEETYRDAMIKSDMMYEDIDEWLENHMKDYNVERINLNGLKLDIVLG